MLGGERESGCHELVPKPEPAGFPENGCDGCSGQWFDFLRKRANAVAFSECE